MAFAHFLNMGAMKKIKKKGIEKNRIIIPVQIRKLQHPNYYLQPYPL